MTDTQHGTIMQLQNLTVNDGEGIRTMVFLAGCPLRCAWCANPEGQNTDNPMVHEASVDEIVREIHSQDIFYRFSGGGVTFSGGEATSQPAFLLELVDRLYDEGYDVALETCGLFDFNELEPVLRKLNLIFMDIKHLDSGKHKAFTGVGNVQILENIKRVYHLGIPLVIRIPTIIGVNATDKELLDIFHFIHENLPDAGLELLPYHTFGDEKYRELQLPLPSRDFNTPSQEQMKRWQEMAEDLGIRVVSYR